ncbi:hypothetical protein [Candidatus Albibeggiatoa sp. nov. NOAA]|uniref:hypothetical protein n=1 Tax=Candidatus Albibeggiatoa sp. nov. NOAA TaxID=3162724 RepID=UPI0032F6465C|nr:hypothetical protein [Thiotrichaceae bacterium]
MSLVKKSGVVLLLTLLVILFNYFVYLGNQPFNIDASFISNKAAFSFELGAEEWHSPGVWIPKRISEEQVPAKYRLLGRALTIGTFFVFQDIGFNDLDAFYFSYMLWVTISLFLFLFTAGELLTLIMTRHNTQLIPQRQRLFYVSVFVAALLPPVLFAFKFPVHGSPNDFLSYTLIALSLIALAKEKYQYFVLIMIVSIFCRETNLISLAPLMLMQNISLLKRVSISFIVVMAYAAYRLMWPGHYDPLEGSAHNYIYPMESLLFLFLVFGPVWLLGILGYLSARKSTAPDDFFIQALNKSFLPVMLCVILVVWLFARVREIRIEYILFFYLIPYALLYCINQIPNWKQTVLKPISVILILTATMIFSFAILVQFMPENAAHHLALESNFAHFYAGFGGGWIPIFIVYFSITVIFLFFSITHYVMRKYQKLNAVQSAEA